MYCLLLVYLFIISLFRAQCPRNVSVIIRQFQQKFYFKRSKPSRMSIEHWALSIECRALSIEHRVLSVECWASGPEQRDSDRWNNNEMNWEYCPKPLPTSRNIYWDVKSGIWKFISTPEKEVKETVVIYIPAIYSDLSEGAWGGVFHKSDLFRTYNQNWIGYSVM